MLLKTFKRGGVHPEENKLSSGRAIIPAGIPETATIPLSQNIGPPSKPIVVKGEKVKTGQLIAEGPSFISANIHSPVSGTIIKIDQAMDVSGYRRESINGLFFWTAS